MKICISIKFFKIIPNDIKNEMMKINTVCRK